MLRPPAKLNLYLEIVGKRPDGFHELKSVFHAINLTDRLSVERRSGGGIDLELSGREIPAGGENLVVRAAKKYVSAMKCPAGLSIHLEKNIPIGAGLGGGSADAAAMLLALNRLFDHPASRPDLERLAAELGSDVPFFLTGGTAVVRGRGEQVEPLPFSESHLFLFVLLYPGAVVPTERIYRNLKLDLTIGKNNLGRFLQMLDRPRSGGPPEFFNALERPFREEYPELADLQDRVSAETGLGFRVTGSGSAMFAAVPDRARGEQVVSRLQAVAAGETYVCESLPGFPG
ncbi:MAG: 4-(cytidine 5'-diphospho)-2-C-methyl-D-erythritol kinase [Planctomycetota bacterium]